MTGGPEMRTREGHIAEMRTCKSSEDCVRQLKKELADKDKEVMIYKSGK